MNDSFLKQSYLAGSINQRMGFREHQYSLLLEFFPGLTITRVHDEILIDCKATDKALVMNIIGKFESMCEYSTGTDIRKFIKQLIEEERVKQMNKEPISAIAPISIEENVDKQLAEQFLQNHLNKCPSNMPYVVLTLVRYKETEQSNWTTGIAINDFDLIIKRDGKPLEAKTLYDIRTYEDQLKLDLSPIIRMDELWAAQQEY